MDGRLAVEFDPHTPENISDPFPALAVLRENAPVYWSDKLRAWIVTRYDDIRDAFRDPRLSSDRIRPFIAQLDPDTKALVEPLSRNLTLWAVFNDPPKHTRLRGLMNKAFTSRAVDALRPRIADIANGLLDAVEERERGRVRGGGRLHMDVIADFAYPLPATVIADMLGVPRKDVALLKKWSDDLATFVLTSRANPEKYRLAAAGLSEMTEYFADFVESHVTGGVQDVTTGLIAARDEEDKLSTDELVASCVLLLFAGHETTTQLLGNGTLALLRHPDQLDDLSRNLDDVALVRNAVEEMLRFDGPSLSIVRVAAEDFSWHGQEIKRGERVFLFQAAGNRDARIFRDPDALNIRRTDANRNIAFGYGLHFCVGAPLARLEGEVAFPVLLERCKNLRLEDGNPPWSDSLLTRGMHELKVSFDG